MADEQPLSVLQVLQANRMLMLVIAELM